MHVSVGAFEPCLGSGKSKREAEQTAAEMFLLREGVWQPPERDNDRRCYATHSGFVALIGAPNAGKSTLVNQLVGAKVSIVTHKVQTTRAIVRGIATHKHAQIVFIDTPGIFARAAGWTRRWSRPPGAAPRMPTSCSC